MDKSILVLCKNKKSIPRTVLHFTVLLLNPSLAEHDMPCLSKQCTCRSRSVGFWRSQMIWICTVCHQICEFLSKTWIKKSDWLEIRSGCGILIIYSAWQGLSFELWGTFRGGNCQNWFGTFWKGSSSIRQEFSALVQLLYLQRRPFSERDLCERKANRKSQKLSPL